MNRLVEQEFPGGSIEQRGAMLLDRVVPTKVDAGSKQRVREKLLRTSLKREAPLLAVLRRLLPNRSQLSLRAAVVVGLVSLVGVGIAGAGIFVWSEVGMEESTNPAPVVTSAPGVNSEAAPSRIDVEPVEELPNPDDTEAAPEVTTEPPALLAPEAEFATPTPPRTAKPEAEPAATAPAPEADVTEADVTEASMLFEATRALRHEGNPGRASRILAEYFQRFPGGALSEEALALSVEAAQKRGDPRAVQLAKRYLKLYPGGHFRSRAERVIENAALSEEQESKARPE